MVVFTRWVPWGRHSAGSLGRPDVMYALECSKKVEEHCDDVADWTNRSLNVKRLALAAAVQG